MDEPTLMRENQIGITYNEGEIRDFHFEIIFERILRIREEQIDAIDRRGPSRFLFKVASNELYDTICEQFTGRDIPIGYGCVIQVDDISSSGTRIELSKVPFQVSNDMIAKILQCYGDVYKCTNYYKKFGKYRDFKSSGDRIAWVKLKKHIPQSILLKNTQTDINVQYTNQPMSCNKCGISDHRAWRCNTQRNDYVNIVELHLNDLLETEPVNSTSNLNVSEIEIDDGIDIHMEASQNTQRHECSDCSFSCTYLEIFNEHKKQNHTQERLITCCKCEDQFSTQVNTGEKPDKCDKCENNSKDEVALEEHILLHNGEKYVECTECEYKCKNVDILNSHLKSHNIYVCYTCEFKGKTQQALAAHIKVHKQKSFKCSNCDYVCTTLAKMNAHKKDHSTGEVSHIEIVNKAKNTPSNNKSGKRDLSISPEVTDANRKTANIIKRSKN